MANTNFRMLNSRLVNRVVKGKTSKTQFKTLNKIFNTYKTRMKQNSKAFFKNNKDAIDNFNNYTINSIYERVSNWIETKKGVNKLVTKEDATKLKSVLAGLIRNSRVYQKEVLRNDKLANGFSKYDKNHLFDYVITHPITTEHSKECAFDLQGSPYKRDEAIRIQKTKPNHVNCHCKLVPRQSNILIEQGNF